MFGTRKRGRAVSFWTEIVWEVTGREFMFIIIPLVFLSAMPIAQLISIFYEYLDKKKKEVVW